jgi:antitoxin PrlF
MSPKLDSDIVSTLTERYQTTIPSRVREALGLNKHDKIRYKIQRNGEILISRVDQRESDPVVEKFLEFLAQDMENNPQHLTTISSDLINHAQSLVSDVEVNLDEPLSDEDE